MVENEIGKCILDLADQIHRDKEPAFPEVKRLQATFARLAALREQNIGS